MRYFSQKFDCSLLISGSKQQSIYKYEQSQPINFECDITLQNMSHSERFHPDCV